MEEAKQLFAAIRKGDEAAFKKLFYTLYDQLYRQAYRYVGDAQVAEEVVQDIFVNLWKNRQKIILHTSLEAYLSVSTRNHSLNYLKSRYAQQRASTQEVSETDLFEAPETEDLPREELRKILESAIQSLPEKCRIIFSLSRDHGLTYQEIADELGITKETVKTQIKIALQKLRQQLRGHWELCLLLLLFY